MRRTITLHPGELVAVPAGWRLEADDKSTDPVCFEAALVGEIMAAEGDENAPKRFTMTAYTGGPMSVGFGDQAIVDLAGVRLHAEQLPILRDHDRSRVLGHSDAIELSEKAIKVTGVLSGANEHTAEVVASAKQGFPWRASIGASIERMEFVKQGTTVKVNGRTFNGPVYVSRQTRITEISIVAIPADPKSTTKVAASANTGQEHIVNFTAWLKSKNLVEADLSETRLAALRAEFDAGVADGSIKAEQTDPPPAPAPTGTPTPPTGSPINLQAQMQAEREIRATEEQRIADIQAAAPKPAHAEIRARAIREGWDKGRVTTEVELVDLRASRSVNANTGRGGSGQAPTAEVLECAMLQSLGFREIEDHFTPEVLQASHTSFRGMIGLQEALMVAAQSNGYAGNGPSAIRAELREVLGYALSPQRGGQMQASFSTLSLPGILSNIANKFLLDSFNRVEQTWREISSQTNVRDFKQITSYRLGGNMAYDEVGPDGELKHGSLSEQSFTNQAKTYGKLFSITRTNIINDDMSAFKDMPMMIGRGGGLKLNTVFWTEFMDNSTFFATGNANYNSGSGTVFGIAGLTQLEQLFLDQTDPDGFPVSVDPTILLVPTALKTEAELINASAEMRDTTATKRNPTKNPHAGKWKPLCSRYLSSASITGNSAAAYYLLADPQDLPVIEVAFLNGKQEPTVETAEADFDTLGIQMRGFHDFGVAKQEHRAGAKSKGEA